MNRFFISLTVITLSLILLATSVQAQYVRQAASSTSVKHAKRVAAACLGQWEDQKCLKAVSESSLIMVANYGAKLKANGKNSSLETLKNHCAASTAAMNGEYPSDAMRSAYTECANTISDINDETGIAPDASHYQLLIAPILCLQKDHTCKAIEDGLMKYR